MNLDSNEKIILKFWGRLNYPREIGDTPLFFGGQRYRSLGYLTNKRIGLSDLSLPIVNISYFRPEIDSDSIWIFTGKIRIGYREKNEDREILITLGNKKKFNLLLKALSYLNVNNIPPGIKIYSLSPHQKRISKRNHIIGLMVLIFVFFVFVIGIISEFYFKNN